MSRFILRRLAVASLLLCSFGALAEHYTVPLLVPAGTSSEPQGVVRILNGTDESGTVEIYAIDDAGTRSGPATFMLNASAAVQFTATELASGNASLGLTGGIGSTVGDARLQIETDLPIVPLAFVRAADGTLSAMHDTVRSASVGGSGAYTYEVPIFNPASEATQVSRLRLINPGNAAAAVTIGGRDDSGAAATGGEVTLMLAAGGAQTLTAQQLEAGDTAITGRLGAGTGKWRLTVTSDQPLQVVNIVAATAGYWNNLSTTAAPGAAPADLDAFNERFVGNAVVYLSESDRYTLNPQTGERFTETEETDGVSTTYMGSYEYSAVSADAGRLTLTYDDADVCVDNLYFSTHTAGWFASHCTGGNFPADGTWLGGSWSVEDDEDGGGEVIETLYGVDDSLPGVPTAGLFNPSDLSGGSVDATADGTTIDLNDGGYFELSDGTRYTCTSADGCTVANGTVTAGALTGPAADAGEVDRFPSFRGATNPGDRTYTVGTAIDTLTLPEASGGNGTLSYSLTPSVPGLSFNATTRQLSGTPSAAGTHAMTYTVTDEDGDTDTLGFTITVSAGTPTEDSLGECYVSLTVGIGQSCTYPGTTDAFSVNARGRGSFLTFLAGIRIRIDNQTIAGRAYDFKASHQGDGVWRIDRIAGSTEAPSGGGMELEDTLPSFAADAGPGNQTYTVGTAIDTLTLPTASGGDGALTYSLSPDVPGLIFNATTRQLTGTPNRVASYNMTYTATDDDGDADTLRFAIMVVESDDGGDSVTGAVTIADANLRAAVEAALGKANGAAITGADMATLSSLTARSAGIADLTGLESAANLTELHLGWNNISDASPLATLANLQVLSLRSNNISDTAFLVGLTSLTDLSLEANAVADVSPLSNLASLTVLYLGWNRISDPSPLANLAALESLDLQSNNTANLSFIAGLANLECLSLGFNGITDVSPLIGSTSLTELWLYGNRITDVSPLSGLTDLTTLILWENNISDISPLAGLVRLNWLSIGSNPITNLSPLEGLTNLTRLALFGINITDLSTQASWLADRTNLEMLNLGTTGLSDVSLLAGLTNLKWLHLGNNNVSDLSPLSGLSNLTELWLYGNNIADVSPLAGLNVLTTLRLGNNDLTDISTLGDLTHLSNLGLEFNRITDISSLVGLTGLGRLDLRGNPLGGSSINDHIPELESRGASVFYDSFGIGDYDIDLVFSDAFTERQKNVLQYVARRWMAVIVEDLPDYEFSQGWSDTCGDESYEIPAGERIDDLRIYMGTFEGGGAVGYGGPSVLRQDTHLPVLGCMAFDLNNANLLITGLHEIGHVLGFGTIWSELGFLKDLDGDTHFNGPLAIAAFDEAGGSDYAGAKVPVEKMDGAHWRPSELPDELMGPMGGSVLSAITVQSLADLGYGVDATQADSYTLPSAATVQAGSNKAAASMTIDGADGLQHTEPTSLPGFNISGAHLTGRGLRPHHHAISAN